MKHVALYAAATLAAYSYYKYLNVVPIEKIKKPRRRRRWWVKTIDQNGKRDDIAADHHSGEISSEPTCVFQDVNRMSEVDFKYLLDKIEGTISKKNTSMRQAISAETRLAITLRYLITGESFHSLQCFFGVSSGAISRLVPEVCAALNQALEGEMKVPSTAEEWLEIEKGFKDKFPHAIGVVEGKHIVIRCPDSGTEYNYRETFSIFLLALVDSDHRFISADIGSHGRIRDDVDFRKCALWMDICQNKFNFPSSCPLEESDVPLPYVLLGNGAFELSEHLMTPYLSDHRWSGPKRVFNDRLSRSRMVSGNTFGLLTARFGYFKRPSELSPEKVRLLTMTCLLLHNFLMKSPTSHNIYNPPGTFDVYENGVLVEGSWRQEIPENCTLKSIRLKSRRSPVTEEARIREQFTTYFSSYFMMK